jgi:hypothetical protein
MKSHFRRLAALAAAFGAALLLAMTQAACSGDDPIAVTGVELSQKAVSVPIGAKVDLRANVKPSDASNKEVSWESKNTSVATVSAAGTVMGVALGAATITVTTKDGNFTDTCVVTVTPEPVAVTGVAVSKKIAVAIGGTSLVSAEVLPHGATNKAITWGVDPAGVVSVVGNAYGADVTGIAAGTATVTATTVEGNKTASCEVTVGQSLGADIYVIYYEKLYLNAEYDPLSDDYYFLAIQTDSAGVLHATANDNTGHAVYLKDGAPTVLPCAANSILSYPTGLFVTLDGRAYVAYTDWTDDGGTATAMLWCDGQPVPMQGASDALFTAAYAVYVSDGNVYVVGGESESNQHISALDLWINGVKTSYPDCPALGTAVAAIGNDIYIALDIEGMVMWIDAADPQRHEILGQYYLPSDDERETHYLTGLTASKGVLYACGFINIFNDDASQEWSAAYWANHVKLELEYDSGAWDGTEATFVCVPPSGAAYVVGALALDFGGGYSGHRGAMWKDGKYLSHLDGLVYPRPSYLAIREVAEANATVPR